MEGFALLYKLYSGDSMTINPSQRYDFFNLPFVRWNLFRPQLPTYQTYFLQRLHNWIDFSFWCLRRDRIRLL